jgi:hypothetical protein
MFKQINWVERKFDFNFPVTVFPCTIERFRGTPARVEEMTKGLSEKTLTFKPDGKWSIKEQIGHLIELEKLGEKRLHDFLAGAETLSAADMSNRATNEADYNSKQMGDILKQFRSARQSIISRLEKLDEKQAAITSIHPRINLKMRIIDWVYFMSEHDDHHLTSIRLIIESRVEN